MSTLKIGCMSMGAAPTNCYYIYEEGGAEAFVVDPPIAGKRIYDSLLQIGLQVKIILLTHAHYDHILGVEELVEASGAEVYAFEDEKSLCEDAELNCSARVRKPCTVKTDVYLKDGDDIPLGEMVCKVISTPGHTKGSCCYYFEEAGMLISGDTLVRESAGRTDLPTGDKEKLRKSIIEKLFVLPDDTNVYPGHEDETTIGYEKKHNCFINR